MAKRWILKAKPEEQIVQNLMDEVHVPYPLATILAQRGITNFNEAKTFFRPKLEDLHNPFLMKDMDLAIDRIQQAISKQENIMVYGDYDVDGTTSVSLLYSFLAKIYDNVSYYIPDRYKEGYGVSKEGIDFASDNDISLIIALDCGVKAIDNVQYAKENGVDFIICDHHLPGDQLPDAVAVLDPKRADCDYPYKGLSGCGVGFKLVQALAPLFSVPKEEVYNYLDLVVVSIAADIVPITGENRVLAHFGLKQLNSYPRLGLNMLIPKESRGNVNISKIVFSIAPKINAAGRIKHATDAVKLLITDNEITARGYLSEIKSLNDTRKDLDANITENALRQIKENGEEDKYTTVVYEPSWHKGVIGIVASRLIDQYYRPTVVFTKGNNGSMVASVRSVKDFDVYEALTECADLLDRYGGHMYAAGLTMPEVNYPNFKRRFEQVVKDRIEKIQRIPSVEIDTELRFNEITPKFVRILNQFQPFGPGNMRPVFLTKNVKSAGDERLMGTEKEHLKLNVFSPDTRQVHTAVGFGMGDLYPKIKYEAFDMVYVIEENYWQGKAHLQLQIKDVRFHD